MDAGLARLSFRVYLFFLFADSLLLAHFHRSRCFCFPWEWFWLQSFIVFRLRLWLADFGGFNAHKRFHFSAFQPVMCGALGLKEKFFTFRSFIDFVMDDSGRGRNRSRIPELLAWMNEPQKGFSHPSEWIHELRSFIRSVFLLWFPRKLKLLIDFHRSSLCYRKSHSRNYPQWGFRKLVLWLPQHCSIFNHFRLLMYQQQLPDLKVHNYFLWDFASAVSH